MRKWRKVRRREVRRGMKEKGRRVQSMGIENEGVIVL